MGKAILHVMGYIVANSLVMILLHGNSRQWWPKIPWLSLRDESIAEHSRLLFNTVAVVTLVQSALGRISPARRTARLAAALLLPLLLPLFILFGRHGLRLQGEKLERYYLSMVPLLPLLAGVGEELWVRRQKEG